MRHCVLSTSPCMLYQYIYCISGRYFLRAQYGVLCAMHVLPRSGGTYI